MAFSIEHVGSLEELGEAYAFADEILGLRNARTLEVYEAYFREASQLLVVARCAGRICGIAFGNIEGDHVLASAVAVAADARRIGIGTALMRELELRTLALGQHTMILAAAEAAEPFYLSCHYLPHLFVQQPEGCAAAKLKVLNTIYDVVWEYEDAEVSKLMLGLPQIDKSLQRAYERAFPTCHTQVVFIKHI